MASRALRAFQTRLDRRPGAAARPSPTPSAAAAAAAVPPFAGERRRQVERNLRRVHGPDFGGLALRRAVAATFESYARY